jgi:hypothetical protein
VCIAQQPQGLCLGVSQYRIVLVVLVAYVVLVCVVPQCTAGLLFVVGAL